MSEAMLNIFRLIKTIYKKMNHSDQFLRALGTLISDYASLSGCTYAEVCSELKISPQTYSKVWKGQTSNIVYYRDIYAYIRSELSRESQREQMDIQLLRLFANLLWVRLALSKE